MAIQSMRGKRWWLKRQQVDSDDFKGAGETFKRHWQSIWVMQVYKQLPVCAMPRRYWWLRCRCCLSWSHQWYAKLVWSQPARAIGWYLSSANNKDAAVKSYNNAWELLRSRQETRAVLALKMESLGIVPEPIAPQGLSKNLLMPSQSQPKVKCGRQ